MSALWCVTVVLPMQLPSAGNAREHEMERHRRVKKQRDAAHLAVKTQGRVFLGYLPGLLSGVRPAVLSITMTRGYVSPCRPFDEPDNIEAAFKAFRDGTADALARAEAVPGLKLNKRGKASDSHRLLRWERSRQELSPRHEVRIHLEVVREAKHRDA